MSRFRRWHGARAGRPSWQTALLAGLLIAGFSLLVLIQDVVWLQAVGLLVALVALGFLLIPPFRRGEIAEGWTGDVARRLLAMQWRAHIAVFAVALALIAVGEGVKACCYPKQELTQALEQRFGPAAESRLPFSRRPALEFVRDGVPTAVAAEVEDVWPPEDQRYTPVGVLLRYEERIVAVLHGEDGTSRVLVADDQEAYRVFAAQLADFWGASYGASDSSVRSARAVPRRADLDRLARVLRAAARDQQPANSDEGPCYEWSVEVRSGSRSGLLAGSQQGQDRALALDTCSDRFTLEGFIDPNAGRFRKGNDGDWSLGIACFCITAPSNLRLHTPQVEMIDGKIQEPGDSGKRNGKGLIEHIEALPLLAAEAQNTPFVTVPRPAAPPRTPLSPTERSDAERRAERSPVGIVAAFSAVAAGALLLTAAVLAICGAVLRLTDRGSRRP